jgi:ferric-dicitrate binding protein FerR (iron transport regulator)
VLSKGINVEASLQQTKKGLKFRTKKRWIIYLRQAAAILLISLSLSVSYNYFFTGRKTNEVAEHLVYQEIKASYGTQTKVVLADGTIVWLNSGSTLKFPASFKNTSEREVNLNGEGFFEVAKDDLKPFIVNTSMLDVKVYGTSFNISAYDDYQSMTIALEEGKVSVIKDKGNLEKELIVLKPSEVVEYNTTDKKLYHSSDSHIEKHSAWKDGHIIFYGDPIDLVIKRLEKWYNIKIIVQDDELQGYRFTATFIDESLEQMLSLLSLSSPMTYKIIPAQKLEDNSYSKRKVILSIKNN